MANPTPCTKTQIGQFNVATFLLSPMIPLLIIATYAIFRHHFLDRVRLHSRDATDFDHLSMRPSLAVRAEGECSNVA